MNRISMRALILAFAVLLSGCAGTVTNMREVPAAAPPPAPEPGKALVIFMRPSGLGFAIQSSVFEVQENNPVPALIGIVAAKTKVAYRANPGKYTFMTIGENADFMTAELLAGKTYYVRVEPRMGMWKARFGLEPIAQKELAGTKLAGELSECKWVEKSAESDAWAVANMPSIQSKRTEYYRDWIKQEEAKKPRLLPEDGR
jgi:hypothetical protein